MDLSPIAGFIDAPLLVLADAVALAASSMTAEELDPMLATRVELACDFADGLLADCEESGEVELLERDEIAAIHLYTQHATFYEHLNFLLRLQDRYSLETFAPYLKLLLGALYKLPRVKATVYRGIKENVSASHMTGTKSVWWTVSSVTLSVDSLSSNQYFGHSGQRTLFSIAAQHAIDISRYSSVPSESELILVPGTRLRVVACLPAEFCIVQCEEIGSPLGFLELSLQAKTIDFFKFAPAAPVSALVLNEGIFIS